MHTHTLKERMQTGMQGMQRHASRDNEGTRTEDIHTKSRWHTQTEDRQEDTHTRDRWHAQKTGRRKYTQKSGRLADTKREHTKKRLTGARTHRRAATTHTHTQADRQTGT